MRKLKYMMIGVLALVGFNNAQAVPASVDVMFIVDVSGSMGNERNFFSSIVNSLDSGLATAGIGTRNYGVVGYSNGGAFAGNVGGTVLTSAAQAATDIGNLSLFGGIEDGLQAMQFAMDNYALNSQAINFILITDEDSDNIGPETPASVQANLLADNIILNAVVSTQLRCGDNSGALGINGDPNGDCWKADGSGGFTSQVGGANVQSASGNTEASYIDVAFATGGAAWEIGVIDNGGSTLDSFAAAFIDIKVEEIITSVPEPATLALMGLGLAAAGFRRRA